MSKIILSADKLSWSAPVQHGSRWDKSRPNIKNRDAVLKRDNHTCQGCGWRAKDFQEIHHKNSDHSNFKLSNLETLCPLCHQVFHPFTAFVSGGACMIWLPELSQVQLNRLLIPLFAVLKSGPSHPFFSVSKAIWSLLDMRKVYLENQLGKSDPAVFGQLLLNLSKEEYEAREEFLDSIKMLALPNRFETEIDYWKACLEKERDNDGWVKWSNEMAQIRESLKENKKSSEPDNLNQ